VTGAGSISTLGQLVKEMGKSRVMVITDRGLKDLPLIHDLKKKLVEAGLAVSLFGDIDPNPVESIVHAAVKEMERFKPDILVGVGGGSPIDVGKAANVVYTHGGVVNDYDIAIGGIMKITPKLLPFIAVPTTAGTGTEVTFVGVITDTKKKTKFGVLSPLVIPDVALLDPELTISMPAKLTAFTGIDALTIVLRPTHR
jgi:alcohol dehydrogenase class IV